MGNLKREFCRPNYQRDQVCFLWAFLLYNAMIYLQAIQTIGMRSWVKQHFHVMIVDGKIDNDCCMHF